MRKKVNLLLKNVKHLKNIIKSKEKRQTGKICNINNKKQISLIFIRVHRNKHKRKFKYAIILKM